MFTTKMVADFFGVTPRTLTNYLNKYEDGDLAFVKMDEELKKRIDSYGNLMIDQYLKRVNYLFI